MRPPVNWLRWKAMKRETWKRYVRAFMQKKRKELMANRTFGQCNLLLEVKRAMFIIMLNYYTWRGNKLDALARLHFNRSTPDEPAMPRFKRSKQIHWQLNWIFGGFWRSVEIVMKLASFWVTEKVKFTEAFTFLNDKKTRKRNVFIVQVGNRSQKKWFLLKKKLFTGNVETTRNSLFLQFPPFHSPTRWTQ